MVQNFAADERKDERKPLTFAQGALAENQHLFWLRLVGWCALATLLAALGFAILAVAGSATFAAAQSAGEAASESTFSGMITDEHCGAKHERYAGKSASECARLCVLNGAHYVLLDGDKVYALAGKDLALDKVAGQRATVTGTLRGSVIEVTRVASQNP